MVEVFNPILLEFEPWSFYMVFGFAFVFILIIILLTRKVLKEYKNDTK